MLTSTQKSNLQKLNGLGAARAVLCAPDGSPIVIHQELLVAKKLNELKLPKPGAPDELLLHRFLCRETGMLFVGSAGSGKSSAEMQMAICWALGRPALGIYPNGKLKSLIVQSENDEGDMAEMCTGVFGGLELSGEEIEAASEGVQTVRVKRKRGKDLTRSILPILECFKPDLVWIDPALAYLSGDANNATDVGAFVRETLDPIVETCKCAVVVVHHTPKLGNKQNNMRLTPEAIAYAGAGSAEWVNWARAALFLERKDRENFILHAAKRGIRLGWVSRDGEKRLFEKPIRYSRTSGMIFWEEVEMNMSSDDPALDRAALMEGYKNRVFESLVAGKRKKATVLIELQAAGLGLGTSRPLIGSLVDANILLETKQGRSPFIELNWAKMEMLRPDLFAQKRP